VEPSASTEDAEAVTDAGEEADAMIEGAEAETIISDSAEGETAAEEEAQNEVEQVDDTPGTPWGIWLGIIGGGFLLALIVAWLIRHKKPGQ
jgi:hypothetical protein